MKLIFASLNKNLLNNWKELFFNYDFLVVNNKKMLFEIFETINEENIIILDELFFNSKIEEYLFQIKEESPMSRVILVASNINYKKASFLFEQKIIKGYIGLLSQNKDLFSAYKNVLDGKDWIEEEKLELIDLSKKNFFVEEKDSSPKIEEKNNILNNFIKKAIYRGKFDEYMIIPSKTMQGYFVITDLVENRDSSDLISSEIDEFIFQDTKKTYNELVQLKIDEKKPIYMEIYDQEEEKDLFLRKIVIKENLEYEKISFIQIEIFGYNYEEDIICFDEDLILNNTNFIYILKPNNAQITLKGNLDKTMYENILSSFVYKKISNKKRSRNLNFKINIDNLKIFNLNVDFLGNINRRDDKSL